MNLQYAPVIAMKARMGPEGDDVECPSPDVPPDLVWIWRAWWRLTDARPWYGGGMGPAVPAPISFDSVLTWSKYYEHDDSMIQMLDACIREMDATYIKHVITKQKS